MLVQALWIDTEVLTSKATIEPLGRYLDLIPSLLFPSYLLQ